MNGPSDKVYHYGIGKYLTITDVGPASYYENGSWLTIILTNGNLVLHNTSFVGEITKNGGTLENNGVIAKPIIGSASSTGVSGTGQAGIDASTVIEIDNSETLINLAMAQSTGVFGNNALNIELSSDIDLTGKTWIPFGAKFTQEVVEKHYRFNGTINGNNHRIVGLNNGNYYGAQSTNSSGITGDTYGFIAYTCGNVKVENITFDDVNIDASNAKVCGAIIGDTSDEGSHGAYNYNGNQKMVVIKYYTDSLKLANINVNGKISAKDKAAGLIGYSRYMKPSTTGSTASIIIDKCNVNASIVAASTRAGGLIGHVGDGSQIEVNESSVSGEIKSAGVYNGNLFGRADGSNGYLKRFITVSQFDANATTTNSTGNSNDLDSSSRYVALKNTANKKLGATRYGQSEDFYVVGSEFTINLDTNEGVEAGCGFYEQYVSNGYGLTTYRNPLTTDGIFTNEGLSMNFRTNSSNVVQDFEIFGGTFYKFSPLRYVPGWTNEELSSNGSITIGEYTVTRENSSQIGVAVYTVTKTANQQN